MKDSILLASGRHLLPIPGAVWQSQVAKSGAANRAAFGRLPLDDSRVRDLAVVELPRAAAPLSPEFFSDRLGLPLAEVTSILDSLERGMTFLFRNPAGAVTWAYPVTVDRTPHRITFSSGERLYAA
jgi:hypothetical protein